MPITADYHMHTDYSFDSEAPLEDMIQAGIKKGLTHMCVTDHMDIGAPVTEDWPEHAWEFNVDSRLYDLAILKDMYRDRIEVNFGIELGLQEKVIKENVLTAKEHDFDFIIGSIHFVNGIDTYWPEYFAGRSPKAAITEYFSTMLSNVQKFKNFDVLGHLDYVVRTVPGGESVYHPSDYQDLVSMILSELIESGRGIELNTSQLAKPGFTAPNPCLEFLKLYKDLGGERITVGSDAHVPDKIAFGFDRAAELLKEAGFNYYCTFRNRKATYHDL